MAYDEYGNLVYDEYGNPVYDENGNPVYDESGDTLYDENGMEIWVDPGYSFDPDGEDAYMYQDGTAGTAADGTYLPSLAGEESGVDEEINSYFSDGMTNEEAAMIDYGG